MILSPAEFPGVRRRQRDPFAGQREGPRCGCSSAVGVVLAVEIVLGMGHNRGNEGIV
jgi:hypothetical protein